MLCITDVQSGDLYHSFVKYFQECALFFNYGTLLPFQINASTRVFLDNAKTYAQSIAEENYCIIFITKLL